MEEKTLDKFRYKNLALFGDNVGLPMMLSIIPSSIIKCVVVARIRPQYIDSLRNLADHKGIPLLIQPKWKSLDYSFFFRKFKNLKIDLIICDSYSMKIRSDILKLVNYNAVNIHNALLPKNRGPNPMQWAIIKGEKATGVTVHYMDDSFDGGDIIGQKKIFINRKDTWISLHTKLIIVQKEVLKKYLPLILKGLNKRRKQKNHLVTINRRLNPLSPKIDFKIMNNLQIYDLIRAQIKPLKGAYIKKDRRSIYIDHYLTMQQVKLLRKKYGK